MERLLNIIKQHAGALDQGSSQPRFATVTSVNAPAATARVTLQPEGVLSGWLPVLSPWIGAGWGLCSPPSPGDQVMVLAQEGDAEHGSHHRTRILEHTDATRHAGRRTLADSQLRQLHQTAE